MSRHENHTKTRKKRDLFGTKLLKKLYSEENRTALVTFENNDESDHYQLATPKRGYDIHPKSEKGSNKLS